MFGEVKIFKSWWPLSTLTIFFFLNGKKRFDSHYKEIVVKIGCCLPNSIKTILTVFIYTLFFIFGASSAIHAQDQGIRPPGTHQDNTKPEDWITRLERLDRIPGLKIAEVIECLDLNSGMVIADIGAGTGAYTIPFAKAVAPKGIAIGVDIHPELLEYIDGKARKEKIPNLQTVLAKLDDPNLPENLVDIAFFHDVFHNVNDRMGYLRTLAKQLKPTGKIVIIEQEFNDPIAQKWDIPSDRITKEQLAIWMNQTGFKLINEFDIFMGDNNPKGAGMPERWFVVYGRK